MTKKKLLALCLAMVMFVGCCVQAVKKDIMKPMKNNTVLFEDLSYLVLNDIDVPDVDSVELIECNLANETAVIAQLVRGSELTDEQFQECGQAVTYVEARYLGLSKSPKFFLEEEGDSYYDSESDEIHLSKNGIDNWYSFINEVIHLTYHAYEKEQMVIYSAIDDKYKDLRVFVDAQSWIEETAKYSVCGKQSEELWIEKDAVHYAQSNMKDYMQAIGEYWHYSDTYLNPEGSKENEIEEALIT